MSEKYVYMDWNVFKYIMNPREKNRESDLKMKELIQSLSKYVFPYSEAHLVDLARGYKKENNSFINKDLDSINDITKGKVLGWQDEVMVIGYTDIKVFFRNVLEKSREEYVVKVDPTDYKSSIDLKRLDFNHPMRPELEKNNGILDADTYEKIHQRMLDNIFTDNKMYKNMRDYIKRIDVSYENLIPFASDEAIAKIKYYFSCLDKDKDYLQRNFTNILDCFLVLNNKILNELSIEEKIEIGYGILDFFTEFSEKLKGNNKLLNMTGDIKHLIFAKEAEYFITEDNACYEKTKFLFGILGIKTKVCKINEFVNRFEKATTKGRFSLTSSSQPSK